MNTLFTVSPDGTQISYDRSGEGPAILLLHGGGGKRQDWHETGYVARLKEQFTVITIDLRGHGESGLPTDPAEYTTDKMGLDILAVADACGFEHFILWGMSFGGKIGRYLAVQSERVTKFIMMGTPMGKGVAGERRQEDEDYCAHWLPLVNALNNGTLDFASLSEADQEQLRLFNVPVVLAWVKAMLDWATVEPADFRCPTLWLIGSEDKHAMITYIEYEEALKKSKVQVHFVEGLDHNQVFDEVDRVLPVMVDFTKS